MRSAINSAFPLCFKWASRWVTSNLWSDLQIHGFAFEVWPPPLIIYQWCSSTSAWAVWVPARTCLCLIWPVGWSRRASLAPPTGSKAVRLSFWLGFQTLLTARPFPRFHRLASSILLPMSGVSSSNPDEEKNAPFDSFRFGVSAIGLSNHGFACFPKWKNPIFRLI